MEALVYLLNKGNGQLQGVLDKNEGTGLDLKDYERLVIIKKVH